MQTAITDSTAAKQDSSSQRARGRWKLLRAALLGEAVPDWARSIHQFPGYSPHLVPSKTCHGENSLIEALLVDLHRNEEKLALTCWALMALDPKRSLWTLPIEQVFHPDQQERLIQWLTPHTCQFQANPPALLLTPHADANYDVQCYTLPHTHVYTRERSRSARKTLQELTSHQQQTPIDNTGNICVWDCEIVLAWFLWQSPRIAVGTTLLEVGSGMAAVAALAGDGICSQIFITDGHPDCVWNNRINVRLRQPVASHIQCSVLRWSYDEDTLLCSADATLVSDCTHFEEWHGQLLWTILRHTRVGGSIWMCQPDRGQSWSRFQQLMECTVQGTVTTLQEHCSDKIDELHAQFLSQSSYEPNRHRPRIFQIIKRQEIERKHRDAIQEFIRNRE